MIRFLLSVALIITASLGLQAQYSTLFEFSTASGSAPLYSALISDGTFLYGMTSDDGTFTNGTVFKIKPDGTGFAKLHDFGSISLDGDRPFGSLYSDGTFLYGMTIRGGTNGQGTIFKVKPDGTLYSKIYDFVGSLTGTDPYGTLISDGTLLYGTASDGGANTFGTIFKIKTDGTGFVNIHDFAAATGSDPQGDLVYDGTFLYGMTFGGGTNNGGVLFKIMPDGSAYTVIKNFGTPDADTPYTGALILDGNFLYGMTQLGGTSDEGAIFKIKTDGTGYVKLHDFSLPDGGYPLGALSFDGQFLYGMTQEGGPTDLGILFRIKTDGTGFEKLMGFDGVTSGYDPLGTLLHDGNALYGMTIGGGANDLGTIFKYSLVNNFITQWDLATAGSGTTQLTFGTATSGTVNYTWQEISPGTASGSGSWSGATLTITGLPAGATIRLQIAPTNFQRIIINSGTDSNRLRLVEQWGDIGWTSMQRAFYDCQNLQITATDVPNLSSVTNMSEMFSGCINLNSPSNMGSWNTATVTNMYFMFYGATAFNQNISGWNTGAVTNMSTMFSEAAAFNQPIGTWNTGAVTDMSGMFQFSSAFNQNISAWNTAAVTDMSFMFSQAPAFNQNIETWNTGAVTDMRGMFRLAVAFNQNIGVWALHPTVDVRNIFDDSGMNCNNYSSTLIGWSANPSTPNGRTLGAIGRQYGTNAVAARTNLISAKSWTITGDTPSGTVCSSSTTITITQQPLNPNNRCEGQDFTFSTDATGTTNITFQWQKFNTTNSLFENISDGVTYSGTNTKNLLITNIQLAQDGDYRCMIQGDLATTVYCNTGTLTVNAVPTAPTVTDGSRCGTGSVTVSASGTTDGNYIWYGSNGVSEPIPGENNATYLTPVLTGTAIYYVSIVNSFCESILVLVNATITGPCNSPPAIATTAVTLQLQGNATIDLLPLLSDPDNDLDLTTLSITQQPSSGALITLVGTNLFIDYSGVNFSGTDAFRISVCDLNGVCTEQEFSIQVVGDVTIYNALSPGTDGKNDFFNLEFIDVLESTSNNNVTIYNRWGDVVWDGTNYNNSTVVFTGISNNGKELPSGTYFYKIDFINHESITGFLSLKR